MRKHTWRIVLETNTIPALILDALPTYRLRKNVNGDYVFRAVTHDPITDEQYTLNTSFERYHSLGILKFNLNSEEEEA
jgi:hypothetical protein